MVKRPRDWVWRGLSTPTTLVAPPAWLHSRALYRLLASHTTLHDSPAKYPAFVAQGKGLQLWEEALHGQIYQGNGAFVRRMKHRMATVPGVEGPHAAG